jgi:hypothetical protein
MFQLISARYDQLPYLKHMMRYGYFGLLCVKLSFLLFLRGVCPCLCKTSHLVALKELYDNLIPKKITNEKHIQTEDLVSQSICYDSKPMTIHIPSDSVQD